MATEGLNSNAPSIDAAREFYQTYTLPRKCIKEGTTDEYRKLEPGEVVEGSSLYGIWDTPTDEIGDFGLGVMMYFKMLLLLMGTMVVCLLLLIPAMQSYSDDVYSGGQPTVTDWKLQFSAICDQRIPVCTLATGCVCKVAAFDTDKTFKYLGEDQPFFDPAYELNAGITGAGCEWVNVCDFDTHIKKVGGFNIAIVLLLAGGLFLLGKAQDKVVEEADEAEQTPQDYSIVVNDPDDDATNPDEWQQFFSQFGHVTYVTVAINNGGLVTALAARRLLCRKIAFETATPSERAHLFDPTENDSVFNELSNMKKKMIGFGLASDVTVMRRALKTLDEKIEELCRGTFIAKKVFVVFDTEGAQRSCLREMSVGTIPAILNQADLPEHQKFRGTNILSVSEAPEPTDVIWENLETSLVHQIVELSCTFSVTSVLVAIAAFIIITLNKTNPAAAAIFVSVCNGGLPTAFKIITNTEEHLTNTSKQSSLLLKLVLSRWLTTAIIIWNVVPFDETLTAGFITKVATVLFADAFTTPIIRAMDPAGRFARNYSAKSAPTQEKMNSFFENTAWFLAERYTDMTKSLFVGLFFASIYPIGLVFSFLSFVMCFWVDRLCLFRLWKQPPAIDASLTVASRMHIAIIIVFHGVIANQIFAGFPFVSYAATGTAATMTLTDDAGDTYTPPSTMLWESTDAFKQTGTQIMVKTHDGMSDDQKGIVTAFSIVNLLVLILVLLGYFGSSAYGFIYSLFRGSYKAVGHSNPDLFSFVPGIDTYVPTFITDALPLPLLCCDLSQFDNDHISFTADFHKQDVTCDPVVESAKQNGVDVSKIFSVCKQYKSPELIASENSKGQ